MSPDKPLTALALGCDGWLEGSDPLLTLLLTLFMDRHGPD